MFNFNVTELLSNLSSIAIKEMYVNSVQNSCFSCCILSLSHCAKNDLSSRAHSPTMAQCHFCQVVICREETLLTLTSPRLFLAGSMDDEQLQLKTAANLFTLAHQVNSKINNLQTITQAHCWNRYNTVYSRHAYFMHIWCMFLKDQSTILLYCIVQYPLLFITIFNILYRKSVRITRSALQHPAVSTKQINTSDTHTLRQTCSNSKSCPVPKAKRTWRSPYEERRKTEKLSVHSLKDTSRAIRRLHWILQRMDSGNSLN